MGPCPSNCLNNTPALATPISHFETSLRIIRSQKKYLINLNKIIYKNEKVNFNAQHIFEVSPL